MAVLTGFEAETKSPKHSVGETHNSKRYNMFLFSF